MKSCKLTLLFLSLTATLPALAADAIPRCGTLNFDSVNNLYTVIKPHQNQVSQQCQLTIYQSGTMPEQAQTEPASFLVEGRYQIEFAGGGGGGAGGAAPIAKEGQGGGGGGGGAGAAPWKAYEYLAPGRYTLTIGAGGQGGKPYGGRTGDGNLTNMVNDDTGALVVGLPDASTHKQQYHTAQGTGHGAKASVGGSTGGDGGNSGVVPREGAEAGGESQNAGAGVPGNAGKERAMNAQAKPGVEPQTLAGGGGGASFGKGGDGDSLGANSVAGVGVLGGGGGGGSGSSGSNPADPGARGGHGYIRLTLSPDAK